MKHLTVTVNGVAHDVTVEETAARCCACPCCCPRARSGPGTGCCAGCRSRRCCRCRERFRPDAG